MVDVLHDCAERLDVVEVVQLYQLGARLERLFKLFFILRLELGVRGGLLVTRTTVNIVSEVCQVDRLLLVPLLLVFVRSTARML